MKIKIFHNGIIAFILLAISTNLTLAQSEIADSSNPISNSTTIFQKIVNDKVTTIKLLTDFDLLLENKNKNVEQEAHISLVDVANNKLNLNVKVRARGVYRRQFCDIPPLRINFHSADLDSLGLHPDFDKLKLVTHCIEAEDSEQVLLREYWTYKLYNRLTPNSFKVHLVKIVYINTKNKKEQIEKLAFLIENNKELADRIGGELIKKYGLTPSRVSATSYQNCSMFNYMIGNLDWRLHRQRNVKLVQLKNSNDLVVIPYDFDMSALVWPSYATLNSDFKQKRFSERFVVGKFISEKGLLTTAEKFQVLKDYYLTCFEKCIYLNKKSKKKMKTFLESFYKPLGNEKTLKKKFL